MSKMYDLLRVAEARRQQKKNECEQTGQRVVHEEKNRLFAVECQSNELQLQDLALVTARISAEAMAAPAGYPKVRATEPVIFIRRSFPGLNRRYHNYLALIVPVIVAGFLIVPGPRLFDKNISEAPIADNMARVSVTAIPQVSTVQGAEDQASTAAREQLPVQSEIHQTVMQWADAWSRRDATAYLSFYAADFSLPDGIDRADWEAMRQSRLRKYASIEVILKNIKISYTGSDDASVSFTQDFRAGRYKETGTRKELHLKKSQGRWSIVRERSLRK